MSRLRRVAIAGMLAMFALYLVGVSVLYVFQRDFLFIGAARPSALPPVPLGYRDLRLTASDGTPLRAWYKPPAPGKSVVLFFHGNGDTIAGSAVAVERFTAQGYGALLPEFRGYGGMPGRPSETLVTEDARKAHDWLAEQGIADAAIVVIGYSLGSGAATQLATEFHPRALILFAAFASIDRVASARLWFVPVRSLITEHFDNEAKLSKVAAPVMLLHGTADGTVPYDNLAVLAHSRPDAKRVSIPGVGHDIVFKPVAAAQALAWLKHLPSTSTRPSGQVVSVVSLRSGRPWEGA